MCYKMHLEASEVISRIPTEYQVQHIIKPLARGEVFATVAGSESWGAGDNWTVSRNFSTVHKVDGGYRLDGICKSYVTSAGEATHYFFICRIGDETPTGQWSLLFVERDAIDWEILEPWEGLGLRGSCSSPLPSVKVKLFSTPYGLIWWGRSLWRIGVPQPVLTDQKSSGCRRSSVHASPQHDECGDCA